MSKPVDLIGDGIENPWNAKTLIDAATMFGSSCFFRDRKNLVDSYSEIENTSVLQLISPDDLGGKFSPVLALENLDSAHELFGFKMPSGAAPVMIVGNEKFGISHDMQERASSFIQIPMPGPSLNTLNVATAAGVALYYLNSTSRGKMQIRSNPASRRPELLFIGGFDQFELGSAIRSAGAFGWDRLLLEDRQGVWFGCDRVTRSEGRSAARRGRNSIRLVAAAKNHRYGFKETVIISCRQGEALEIMDLAGGPQQLIVIPDESQADLCEEDWTRLGGRVRYVKIDVPVAQFNYHYRLFASIALAEITRQVGRKSAARPPRRIKQGPIYESSLALLIADHGEEIFLEDLANY